MAPHGIGCGWSAQCRAPAGLVADGVFSDAPPRDGLRTGCTVEGPRGIGCGRTVRFENSIWTLQEQKTKSLHTSKSLLEQKAKNNYLMYRLGRQFKMVDFEGLSVLRASGVRCALDHPAGIYLL